MRYLREEIKAGLVILVAVLLFSAVAVIIGGVAVWERFTPYRIRFTDATGLEARVPVRLNGLVVGRVLNVRIPPDDVTKVEATVGIREGIPVFDTARATVTYMSLIGDYYLAITQTKLGKRLPPGGMIVSEKTADFPELLVNTSELAESMRQLVTSIQLLFTEKNIKSFSEALGTVKPLMVEVRGLAADLRESIDHLDAVIVENREPLAKAVAALRTDLEKIESALTSLDRLAKNLAGWERIGSHYADDILLNLVGASENLRALSRELREEPWRVLYRPEPGERDKKE